MMLLLLFVWTIVLFSMSMYLHSFLLWMQHWMISLATMSKHGNHGTWILHGNREGPAWFLGRSISRPILVGRSAQSADDFRNLTCRRCHKSRGEFRLCLMYARNWRPVHKKRNRNNNTHGCHLFPLRCAFAYTSWTLLCSSYDLGTSVLSWRRSS